MRVIAGILGGRRLKVPRGLATRPTSDRVREALFSSLRDVQGLVVLDLFAGTGALGIEALSRGADRAVFVEKASAALLVLRENLKSLDLSASAHVLPVAAERALAEIARRGPFDIVFVDPPYADADRALALIQQMAEVPALLQPSARVVFEHASRSPLASAASFTRLSTKVYGDTSITVLTPNT